MVLYSSFRNRDSQQSDTLTRRDYLRTAGTAGIGGLSLSMALGRAGAVSTRSHTLTIEGVNDTVHYDFSVTGSVGENSGVEQQWADRIDGNTASGVVGRGQDSYTFSGELVRLDVNGHAKIYLNGERIDPADYPDNNVLTIEGVNDTVHYEFSATESVGENSGVEQQWADRIGGNTGSGVVGRGRDSYTFSGELISLNVDGEATVLLNGERIDPADYADNILTIEGDNDTVRYEFAATGSVGENSGVEQQWADRIDGNTGSGVVGAGRDSYAFSGELVRLEVNGQAKVHLNGKRINPADYPDNILTITGVDDTVRYDFSVTGNIGENHSVEQQWADRIDGTSASGIVGRGQDSYTFSGELVRVEANGQAKIHLNGKRIDPDPRLKLGYDARARSHRRGRPYESFDEFSKGWHATSGHLSADTERTFDDDSPASARLDGYAEDNRIGMAVDFENGESFAGRDLSLAVRLGEAAHETLRVELWAEDASDQYIATRYLSRADDWVRVDLGPTSIRGSPNLNNVRRFGVECYTGGKRVRMNIDAIRTTPRRDSGAVILTFDDNHHTQYDVAFPEMKRRGMVGTVGVIHDLVGNANRISLDEMREMQAAGWTMASHPQGDDPSEGLGRVSRDRAEQMMRETKGWLVEHGFEEGARCLIWPFGDHDRDSLELAGEYHELSFGGGSSPCPGTVTEAAWVPRVNADDVSEALDAINAAARFDQVLMLMFHTIGAGRISTNDFKRLLNRIEARGLDVLTASDFADEQ